MSQCKFVDWLCGFQFDNTAWMLGKVWCSDKKGLQTYPDLYFARGHDLDYVQQSTKPGKDPFQMHLPRDVDVKTNNTKTSNVIAINDTELEDIKKRGTLSFPPKETIIPYHRHDFLKDKPYQFDKRFKNPCWYEKEQLRCLPYFLLLGVRKCATTSLYAYIMKHPEAVEFSEVKEPQFFGYGQMYKRRKGVDQIANYVKVFDRGTKKIDTVTKASSHKNFYNNMILGDASTDSLFVNYDWHQYPGNDNLIEPKYLTLDYLHHFMPEAKIILVYRDPVERLYSEYMFIFKYKYKMKNSNQFSFHLCVEHLLGLYRQCLQHNTLKACVYNTTIQRIEEPGMFLSLGIYYIYMEEILRVFGKDRVFVIHTKDISDPQGMKKVFEFLEMGRLSTAVLQTIVNRKENTRNQTSGRSPDMLKTTRRLLQDFYKPFNERMAKLMNDKYFLFETK